MTCLRRGHHMLRCIVLDNNGPHNGRPLSNRPTIARQFTSPHFSLFSKYLYTAHYTLHTVHCSHTQYNPSFWRRIKTQAATRHFFVHTSLFAQADLFSVFVILLVFIGCNGVCFFGPNNGGGRPSVQAVPGRFSSGFLRTKPANSAGKTMGQRMATARFRALPIILVDNVGNVCWIHTHSCCLFLQPLVSTIVHRWRKNTSWHTSAGELDKRPLPRNNGGWSEKGSPLFPSSRPVSPSNQLTFYAGILSRTPGMFSPSLGMTLWRETNGERGGEYDGRSTPRPTITPKRRVTIVAVRCSRIVMMNYYTASESKHDRCFPPPPSSLIDRKNGKEYAAQSLLIKRFFSWDSLAFVAGFSLMFCFFFDVCTQLLWRRKKRVPGL